MAKISRFFHENFAFFSWKFRLFFTKILRFFKDLVIIWWNFGLCFFENFAFFRENFAFFSRKFRLFFTKISPFFRENFAFFSRKFRLFFTSRHNVQDFGRKRSWKRQSTWKLFRETEWTVSTVFQYKINYLDKTLINDLWIIQWTKKIWNVPEDWTQ